MRITTVIIGAGQAGLAMSRQLTEAGVDHVVLERGDVANSWRTERWDSLRLLTPNWLSRLPGGFSYRGDDPEGFMKGEEVVDFLSSYARSVVAPVLTGVTVERVWPTVDGFEVATDSGAWRCRTLVVATGAASDPWIPPVAGDLPGGVVQLSALDYRNPGQLPDGEVLVVGASASGVQLADELARHGHPVTLAVGDHVRLPRSYRGRDIHWWLNHIGHLDQRVDEIDDGGRTRRMPSLQLVGTPEHRSLDLNSLTGLGVELRGRLAGVTGGRAQFSGSLPNFVANADLKLNRLLDEIDARVETEGLDGLLGDPSRPVRTRIGPASVDADVRRFKSVVWATGYRPQYPFLDPVMLDRRGRLRHQQGVLDVPGGYVLGLPFMRRRKSSFLDGVGSDAMELGDHLLAHIGRTPRIDRRDRGLQRAS